MIIFDKATITFGNGAKGLDEITFQIDKGEFVVIVGHSGAGKTTLMRTMIKDLLITSGNITVDGDDITKISQKNTPLLRRKIGVVFQDFKAIMDRTVAENILIALDILGLSEDLSQKRLMELISLTGLAGKENMFPIQLSGGELQRVVLARALAPQPKILFADEPTGNLDDETGASIISLLKDINETGTTVLVATHDHHLVKPLHLRTLELDHGKVVKDSGKKELQKKGADDKN